MRPHLQKLEKTVTKGRIMKKVKEDNEIKDEAVKNKE